MSSTQNEVNLKNVEKTVCSICLDDIEKNKASLNGCRHNYHYNCIKLWSTINNTCPLCKQTFGEITQPNKRSVKVKNTKNPFRPINTQNFDIETLCRICKEGHDEDKLLLCDDCDRGYHTYCMTPALVEIPDGDWYCRICTRKRERRAAREVRRNGNRTRRRRNANSALRIDQSYSQSVISVSTFCPPNLRNLVVSAQQREQIRVNRFNALTRLQCNRIRRLFMSRFGEAASRMTFRPPVSEQSQMPLAQRMRIYRNYVNAVELRFRRALREMST